MPGFLNGILHFFSGKGGSKESYPSENITEKPEETDEVSTDEGPSREGRGKNKLPKTTTPKTASLEAILHEVQADAKNGLKKRSRL
jgi:hypothetical protein